MVAAPLASSRRRRAWAAVPAALVALLVAAPSALAQATPIEPVTPPVVPITPVAPPLDPVTPTTPTATPTSTSAVVLVSGFNTSSPFSTPACATTGRGSTWGVATGPAAALTAGGFSVYTAPVANADAPPPTSCLGGQNTPDIPSGGSTVIDSNGELADNAAALVAFLQFLNQSYGITNVSLVGHSDGGLWSRAAISQLRASGSPVTVSSLTTIGTPHTGSFGADLAVAIAADGGSCNGLSDLEYAVCIASYQAVEQIFADTGQATIEELSSAWLSQWNPTTTIGCAVTTLGGDHVGWDLGVGTYYSANDGIVGQASALNQATVIPILTAAPFTPVAPPGGLPQLYDAVHSVSLTFLTATTELNDPALAQAVAAAVTSPPPGPCASPTSGLRSALQAATLPAQPTAKPTAVPLRQVEATRSGKLSALGAGDAVLLLKGASVRCGSRALPTAPLLGSRTVRVAAGICSHRLTTRGRVLKLTQSGARLWLTRSGDTLRYRLTGPRLRDVRVQLRTDGRWRTVRGGRVTVPARSHDPAVRVRAIGPGGDRLRAIGRIAV